MVLNKKVEPIVVTFILIMADFKWGPALRAAYILGPCEAIACACSAASLLGVSLSEIFSIIFCVLLVLFAGILAYIAWKTTDDRFMRILAACGAVLMPVAAVGCIVVDNDFVKASHPAAKSPLYMLIASALLVNFAINIVQLINACSWGGIKDRLLSNNRQIAALFIVNVVLGLVLGLVFGLLDVEDENESTKKMVWVTALFTGLGLITGIIFAFFNEKSTQKLQRIGLDPLAPQGVVQHYDEM